MRVAIVHFTAPPVAGGAEAVLGRHAELLAQHGHQVTIVAGRGRAPVTPAIRFHKVPILASNHPDQKRLANALARGTVPIEFGSIVERIRQEIDPILRNQDAVLVHNAFTLHFNTPLTVALTDLAKNNLPGLVVAWTHDVAPVNQLYAADFHDGYPWDLFTTPQPGVHYVTVSETRREELLALWSKQSVRFKPPIVVIPNGIDAESTLRLPASITKIAHTHDLFRRDIVMLLPVRITRRKNIQLAVRTVAELSRQGSNAVLLITGPVHGHHPQRSRSYIDEVRSLATELSVSDRILFLAEELRRPLTNKEVAALYSLATVLLLPSASEGFGLPLLEAGITRLPIVASDLPVFREVAEEFASFFSLDDPIDRVARLVNEAASRQPMRQRVLKHFDWQTIFDSRIEPFLESLSECVEVSS